MRILHVGKYYAPVHGGIETVLQNTAEGLVRAGHEVRVLCFAEDRQESTETIAGVTVQRAPIYGTLMSQPVCPGFKKMLREAAEGVDVVHLHSPNPLAEFAAMRLPASIPLVCTYHADVTRQKLLLPAYRPVLRRFLERCARIVVATPRHIENSDTLRSFASRCAVIPFGLDPDRFEPTPPVMHHIGRIEARHGKFALFIGRLVSYKGLQHLIDAAAGLNHDVVIIGDGPLAPELRQRIEDLGLQERVTLRGAVAQDDELLGYLHACRVMVLPSTTNAEAFGVVLTEAMACGKPLVTSALPTGVSFVNQHDVNGLHATPGDAESLRAALLRVLNEDDLATRLGIAGRSRFGEEFTVQRMTELHETLYREVQRTPLGEGTTTEESTSAPLSKRS